MISASTRRRWIAFIVWILGVALSVIVISRTTFTTDLSAFLPQEPTREQQVLQDQLLDGVISRLILVGIEGASAPVRAAVSKDMAQALRSDQVFVSINNGERVNAERDQAFLFNNRYLLSPAINPERFTVDGLRKAIGDTIDLLASSAGMMVRPLFPRDPTGEIVAQLEQMTAGQAPHMSGGAWASRDGSRALLLAQTRAAGTDTDGQQQAMTAIRQAFETAVQKQGAAASEAELVMTGPGVFSVLSRQTIEDEVGKLSVISVIIIVSLLLMIYRSLTALALGLLPVVSGALVGIVAVSLGFGMIHGITLGFGTTLIGEAVDYSIYLFVQSRQAGPGMQEAADNWVKKFWPTVRLGVLTSIVGFSSLLASSFPGLAQLGLYSIAGLTTAALVTRFLLPHLLPTGFRIRDVSAMGARLTRIAGYAPLLRWPLLLIVLASCVVVFQQRDSLWNTELSSLSPVPEAAQATDARLRADMGAPDVRYMVVISGPDRDAVLAASEKVSAHLQPLVEQGTLAAVESPSRYLPSVSTQLARQASLPPADELERRLREAVVGLPVRPEVFAPFVADVAAARTRAPLQAADLQGSSLALAVDSLLFQRNGRWNALLPLTAGDDADSVGIAAGPVREALKASGQPNALFVDLKAESDNLYSGYLREAILMSLAGLAGIVLLLCLALRSPLQTLKIVVPLAAAVVTVIALLSLSGQRLTILHLVGLLLVVAVGSNYALFFSSRNQDAALSDQALTSIVFANLTTVAAFGVLGFSKVPVLNAIGSTVGPGAILALIYAASFIGRRGH